MSKDFATRVGRRLPLKRDSDRINRRGTILLVDRHIKLLHKRLASIHFNANLAKLTLLRASVSESAYNGFPQCTGDEAEPLLHPEFNGNVEELSPDWDGLH